MTEDVLAPQAPDQAPAEPVHPHAEIPGRLLPDDAAESRWRQRFTATRVSLPEPARDNPDCAVFVSNASGSFELYTWDVAGGAQVQATARKDGTTRGVLSPDGRALLWFDDTDGDELGSWQWQPFGTGPGNAGPAMPAAAPGYSAGIEVGANVVIIGYADDNGSRVHLVAGGQQPATVYRHECDAGVAALSRDETVWVLAHSEHGDSRYPALRAFSVADGSVLGELDDSPGKGLDALEFSPVPGDQRLLVGHERRGRDELLIWNPADGAVTELAIDLPGDVTGAFYPDGQSVLVLHQQAGRSTLHRLELAGGELSTLPTEPGCIDSALVAADGSVWYRWSNAAQPPQLRRLAPDGTDGTLLNPPGETAPASQPVYDVYTDGPGGQIHSLLARPAGYGALPETGHGGPALPTVFYLHGGPASSDDDAFEGNRAAWLDAGFAVVQVNYRGSTGYGSAWRDALTERVGHTELADVAAVMDDLTVRGVVDPDRCVVAGGSWGGFLTLLALGVQPTRWAAGIAAVPVADYVTAYADEMEPLRAYDRALFGGSPQDKPAAYRDSSPLTYVDMVSAPVLVLAGENDPRCPIKQIENYLDALAARDVDYRVYRFDAGHGSMVVAERIRQVACEISFARAAVGLDRS